MKRIALTITLLAISCFIYAQQTPPTTCQSPSRAIYENEVYFKKNRALLERALQGRPGINTRAYTQSIHNVIAKWDGGSFYRFEIGTSPGLGDINRGHLLRTTDKHTGGHSYEELRRSALEQGTTFNIGDTFYISLYDNNGSSAPHSWVSQPLRFEWEDLGNTANDLTIEVETNYGVNGLGPFADFQRDKMMEFYRLVNPIIKEVYGPPSRDHSVYVVNDENAVGTNTFYNGPNQISTTYDLNSDGDLDQPRLMIHELVHAYRDNVTLSSNDEWHYDTTLSGFEEGMAEAVGVIVMDIFIERYPNFFNGDEFKVHWSHARGMPFDWDYDFQNHEQLTTTDFFSSDIGTGAHWERYGTSQAAMQKMYVEDPEIFKKFNAEYYRRMNQDHNLIPSRDLILQIFNAILPEVERTPITEWINDQRIFDCRVVPGNKVHMLTFHSVDPPRIHTLDNRIHIVQTQNLPDGNEWSWDEIDPVNDDNSKRWYIQTNNINGQLQIFNYNNSLHQSVNIRNNKSSLRDGGPEYLGPYQGPNFLRYNGIFTGNDGRNDCTQPGCGKRPVGIDTHNFWATSSADRGHSDLPNNLVDRTTQIVSDLSALGLYRYEIAFEGSNYSGTYYRLHGQELVQKDGIIGGIRSEDNTKQISGKLIVEHEDFGEEADILINNGAFIGQRNWASVLETQAHRQGGRNDRRYSVPGKVHVIYVSEDCKEFKIDFRNIRYGDGLAGSQLFLFTVEDFEDIIFTTQDVSVCNGEDLELLVENNFPDILDGDSRVTYKWLDPSGTEIATTAAHTIPNPTKALHEGTYILEILFFGCLITREIEVIIGDDGFTVTTPDELTLCEEETLELEVNEVNGATYTWTGPGGFTADSRQITIDNISPAQGGEYTVSVTAPDCNGTSVTKSSTTQVTVNSDIELVLVTSDVDTCEGETVLLTVNEIENATYRWTGPDGFSADSREVNIENITSQQQGVYTVTASVVNCDGSPVQETSSVNIRVESDPAIGFDNIPDTVVLCSGDNFNVEAPDYENAVYEWQGPNGFTLSDRILNITGFTHAMEGVYILTVTVDGCNSTIRETHEMNITSCAGTISIPPFFTPNGDGHNDVWEVDQSQIPFSHIYIYDRYGKMLKQLTETDKSWDGLYNGRQMPSSDYWFAIHLKDNNIMKGHFSLIR
ncbi:T9SS type B sorting domain-containing protein [Leptobacterium flavescens]|uniref:T9SS type B sorting domain-containing protein n=1 Tax=Leptobacterium flavescens TaxID=472055 RepID=A0A6P0UFM2_9FLAO|nr:T9SS type B sorting domain-containing protein [Leptobacterium flavescens]NER12035.1 T9SS type B sorting domain-containing protein [Leptobacterium flavescens]